MANNIYLATKTKATIDAMLMADQGAAFRGWLGKVIPHMSDAYSTKNEPFRTHLGASIIGGSCARKVWYDWHWTTRGNHEGRLLRLFNRGHLEEARFIALLLMMGVQVYQHDNNGKQFRISGEAGHYGGSGDGVAIGLPEVTSATAVLLEFKTHNDKSFQKLVKEGVRVAKPEHYTQMNQYTGKFGIGVALYGAVNKNNDDIHWELVPHDKANYEQYGERAHKIVWMPKGQLPMRINESPGWFECSWCDHKRICHDLGGVPDRNCRTCAASLPIDDGNDGGAWACQKFNIIITKEQQFMGCGDYERGF